MKRLYKKLKTLCLYLVVFDHKDEYVEYGMCPGFTVWKNGGGCIMGHMIIKKSDTKEEIIYKLIGTNYKNV